MSPSPRRIRGTLPGPRVGRARAHQPSRLQTGRLRQAELTEKHELALTALAQSFPGFLSDLILRNVRVAQHSR